MVRLQPRSMLTYTLFPYPTRCRSQSVGRGLGARLGLPGMVHADGSAQYRDYADYIVRHERAPGVGLLAGWRGEDGETHGKGAPNPEQLQRYIENNGFWREEIQEPARYFKNANRGHPDRAHQLGFRGSPRA